jgi:hypothetical protein
MILSQYIATGSHGTVITSPDTAAWTIRDSKTNEALTSILWDGARFLATGFDESQVINHIYISTDGVTWTAQPGPAGNKYRSLIQDATAYLMLTGNGLMVSADLTGWVSVNHPPVDGTRILWNGIQYVMIGADGAIITSPDRTTWTSRTSGTSGRLSGLTWSGSRFVVTGSSGIILSSPDGVLWTVQNSGTMENLSDVAWNGTQFVAVGSHGVIITSPDGTAWAVQNPGTTNSLYGILWDGTKFVVVGAGLVLTSSDGINWTINDFGWQEPEPIF